MLEQSDKFLKGTGTVAGFETSVADTYLSNNARERMHFEFVNEAIWNFLSERYGCDHEIKRFYVNKGQFYSSVSIDARLKLIPIYLVRADDLYEGKHNKQTFKLSFVQISARKSFSEMKKRITDIVIANGLADENAKRE